MRQCTFRLHVRGVQFLLELSDPLSAVPSASCSASRSTIRLTRGPASRPDIRPATCPVSPLASRRAIRRAIRPVSRLVSYPLSRSASCPPSCPPSRPAPARPPSSRRFLTSFRPSRHLLLRPRTPLRQKSWASTNGTRSRFASDAWLVCQATTVHGNHSLARLE